MNPLANASIANAVEKTNSSVSVFSFPTKAAVSQQEDFFGFSTTDGSMITLHAGKHAISQGAGIFIGDYFVGLADSLCTDAALPFIKY